MDYIPSLFSFKNGLRDGVFSLLTTFVDNQIDKGLKKELNGNYVGSLYFQQYVSETIKYQEIDVLLGIGSAIPSSEISISSTILGFFHNFEKRDGKIIATNITGFIKGAKQEINRIDEILTKSDNLEFNDFLYEQKDKLDAELIYNTTYFFNNFSYSNFNTGKSIKIDKTELINESIPLPGIDYSNSIYWKLGE